jgi:hypothetical protein
MPEQPPTYALGPLERRGLVAGWRPGQVLAVAGAALAAGAVVVAARSSSGVVAAVLLLVGGLVVATVPVHGRTLEEWVPSIVAHVSHRRRSSSLELCVGCDPETGAAVLEVGGGRIVVILGVEATGIGLLDQAGRERRVAGLMAALAALGSSRGAIDRVSWSVTCRRGDVGSMAADLRRRGVAGDPRALDAYRSMLDGMGPLGLDRRVDVALRGASLPAVLAQAEVVRRALLESGHRRVWLRSPAEVAEGLADRLGPAEVDGDRWRYDGHAHFGHLATPSGAAVSWWIARWPTRAVTEELLASLLLGDDRRAVTVVLEPVGTAIARRRAASTRTAATADAELRRRGGFLADREGERRRAHTTAREDDLVAGFAALRFAGFVATMAESDAIAAAASEAELAAAASQLELRRLDGDHRRGLLATLPLCGGLP